MTRIARYRRPALVAYVVALFAVTLAPMPSTADMVEVLPILDRVLAVLDKIVHSVLFGGLALLVYWNLDWSARYAIALRAVGLALVLAALVELFQSPLPYRHGDFWDFAAGAVGAVAAAAVVVVLAGKKARRAPSLGG
ncbi:MAG: VanZ family protein [Gemmatimonadota bacterium]|nr:MAG: VanZ family protein [Gemmatimonadota bacterium]